MVCSARLLDVSYPLTPSFCSYVSPAHHNSRYFCTNPKSTVRWRSMSSFDPYASMYASAASIDADSAAKNAAGFCIIEGPETVQDFDKMDIQEIQDNIRSRRNEIFLHMEEVRRLRIQQRIKSAELGIVDKEQDNELPNFPSFIPFLPPVTTQLGKDLPAVLAASVDAIAKVLSCDGLAGISEMIGENGKISGSVKSLLNKVIKRKKKKLKSRKLKTRCPSENQHPNYDAPSRSSRKRRREDMA